MFLLNIYQIAEEIKIMLEIFIMKCLINSTHVMLKQRLLTMFCKCLL